MCVSETDLPNFISSEGVGWPRGRCSKGFQVSVAVVMKKKNVEKK